MAVLTISASFDATHGTVAQRQSSFYVELSFSGQVQGDFVAGLDDSIIRKQLDLELLMLQGACLDAIVGRATNENIAVYLLMRLRDCPVKSVAVSTGGARVEVQASETIFANWPAELAFRKGVSCLLRRYPDKALVDFTQATQMAPNWPAAHNARGRCLRKLGQLRVALQSFNQAIAIDPSFGEAVRNKANAILDLDGPEAALPIFEEAVRQLPQSALAYNNRGYAFQLARMYEPALIDHDTAIRLDANYEEAHRDRGLALNALGRMEEAETAEATANALTRNVDEVANERAKLVHQPCPD